MKKKSIMSVVLSVAIVTGLALGSNSITAQAEEVARESAGHFHTSNPSSDWEGVRDESYCDDVTDSYDKVGRFQFKLSVNIAYDFEWQSNHTYHNDTCAGVHTGGECYFIDTKCDLCGAPCSHKENGDRTGCKLQPCGATLVASHNVICNHDEVYHCTQTVYWYDLSCPISVDGNLVADLNDSGSVVFSFDTSNPAWGGAFHLSM